VIQGFEGGAALERIEIPPSVETLCNPAFGRCLSLREVSFAADGSLKSIFGFGACCSICRIRIPSSVERLRAFADCANLGEVVFEEDCQLQELDGFARCPALSRIEIPSAVEFVGRQALSDCSGLRRVVFPAGTRVRIARGFGGSRPFIDWPVEQLKHWRRRVAAAPKARA
jgi:hypothetical protein